VNRQATQLAHRGTLSANALVPSNAPINISEAPPQQQQVQYGDESKTPIVYVSANGDLQIAMSVNGITCAHCVKIVETVLKGCNGIKSPIDGLLDAAADRALNSVLIQIDNPRNAKRIAFESARNLAMVGYTAVAKEMIVNGPGPDGTSMMNLDQLSAAFELAASHDPKDVMFDWTIPCTCPDNGILRDDCFRYVFSHKNFGAF
jgi:copper chaperone CopZ